MQRNKKRVQTNTKTNGKNKYQSLQGEDLKDTRWHEGHHHDGEQHYHHLTLPPPSEIETDDSEFVDPTEGMQKGIN